MSASACTSSPSRCRLSTSFQARPLSSVNLLFRLLQALESRNRLLCNDGPPFGGVLNAFPQPLGHIVVGLDPGLLECRTETLDVALRLCRVATECCSVSLSAQAAEGTFPGLPHLWSTSLKGKAASSSNRLKHLLLCCRDLHLPQYLAQCAPTLV
jgi:hypothetical protein